MHLEFVSTCKTLVAVSEKEISISFFTFSSEDSEEELEESEESFFLRLFFFFFLRLSSSELEESRGLRLLLFARLFSAGGVDLRRLRRRECSSSLLSLSEVARR